MKSHHTYHGDPRRRADDIVKLRTENEALKSEVKRLKGGICKAWKPPPNAYCSCRLRDEHQLPHECACGQRWTELPAVAASPSPPPMSALP